MNCNTTHYRANSSSVPGDPTVFWKTPQGEYGRYIHYWSPGERSETIWTCTSLNRVTLNLENRPQVLARFDVSLLVPAEDGE